MRLIMGDGPCFSCGGGRTHIQLLRRPCVSSTSILHKMTKKGRGRTADKNPPARSASEVIRILAGAAGWLEKVAVWAGSVAAAGFTDVADDAFARVPAVRRASAARFLVTGACDHRPFAVFRWIVGVSSASDVHHKTVVVRFFHRDNPPLRKARTCDMGSRHQRGEDGVQPRTGFECNTDFPDSKTSMRIFSHEAPIMMPAHRPARACSRICSRYRPPSRQAPPPTEQFGRDDTMHGRTFGSIFPPRSSGSDPRCRAAIRVPVPVPNRRDREGIAPTPLP